MKRRLLEAPGRFSFFQAVRLLALISGNRKPFSDFLRNHLKIRPPVSLGFADCDLRGIREISTTDQNRFEITANFLGLYGPSSPLPTYYTEELIEEAQEERSVKKDFLDILNEPFFKLFYECWSKYRLSIKIIDEKDANYLQRLYGLLGLAEPEIRKRLPESRALLRYAGLFMCHPRSALGLRTLVADFFQLPGVEIEQCVQRTVPIESDQHCLLGRQACELGVDTHIGSQIMDSSGKIRIKAGPLDAEQFHALSPGTAGFDQLVRVIHAYLDQPLCVEIRLIARKEEIRSATLGGGRWSQLGFHTWLKTDDANSDLEPFAEYGLEINGA